MCPKHESQVWYHRKDHPTSPINKWSFFLHIVYISNHINVLERGLHVLIACCPHPNSKFWSSAKVSYHMWRAP
jgi:hypothetical protein